MSKVFLFGVLLLCACTTTPQLPAIVDFADSVTAVSVGVTKRFEEEKISDLYNEEFNQEVTAQKLVLIQEGCADLISPEGISFSDPSLDDFDQHCKLTPSRQSANGGGFEPALVTVPTDQPGSDGRNAQRISLALNDYSKSLKALAESKLPSELGVKFKAAATSAKALGIEVSKLNDGSGLDPKSLAIVETGIDLVGGLLTETFEARRYVMVKRIVEQSQKRVEIAALILATWQYEPELPVLEALYDQLQEKRRAQTSAAGRLLNGDGSEKELLVATRELRALKGEIEKRETTAKWRVFPKIAQAHYAIEQSFEKPGLDAIAAANDRIAALVAQTKEFVQAIEAAEEE